MEAIFIFRERIFNDNKTILVLVERLDSCKGT